MAKRILVVDDEEIISELCWHVLTGEGYHVQRASSGEEAARLAAAEKFHLMVLDMLMPGMNGLETFLAVRKIQREILGVLVTAHGTMDTAIAAIKTGFSGFVKKPFTPVELVQVVKEAFYKAAIMEENTRLKTLIPLYSLGEKFITSRTRKEVLDCLIETVSHQTGSQNISVMLYNEKEGCLRIEAARGVREEIMQKTRVKPGERIAGWVFQNGRPVILNGGPEDNPRFASFLKKRHIAAAISFPLKVRSVSLGVLNVRKLGKGPPFSQADIEMLSVICGQASMALENIRIMDERAERMRMRTLLEQYVAPEVAEVLISHGQNPLEIGAIQNIIVLFADIRDFTPLVQHLPLKDLRSFLNDFFDLFSQVVFKFKGTLDKFMGDAALAMFGAPISLEEPYDAAVSAAVEMMRKFKELIGAWAGMFRQFGEIGLGIGISSGEMFLGNVGSQKRFDYTVIGTDVNLAQRLASEAASGEILISENVRNHLVGRFRVVAQSPRMLKGLESPVPTFSIRGPDAGP